MGEFIELIALFMKKIAPFLSFLLFSSILFSQEYKRMITKGTYTVQEIIDEAESYFALTGTERGKGYKPFKRWEYQALRNMDENGMLKTPEFYFNELENYNGFINQDGVAYRTTVGTWEELGPVNWNQTSGWNPGVGRITSMAFEQGNTNHIIVGAQTGGVWRSTDGGTNWAVLTDNLSNLTVYSLAIDPTNASTYFWGSSNGTIFKSTDSGATWNLLADIGGGNVNKILIDPTNTDKMFCTSEGGGIFKSTNAGTDWTIIHATATNGYDIEFKAGDTNTIYATGNQYFMSTDGGITFDVPNGLTQWSQEYVSGGNDWSTANSNQNSSVTPKTGASMAYFYVANYSQPETRLVSPSLDLSGASNPELKFSHTQVSWYGDTDELRVLYKTSAAGAWTTLATYTTEVTAWSDITLSLPNQSSDYYIAFEGKANYARGVTIDDVSVEDATLGIVFSDGFESAPNTFANGPKMIGVSADNPNAVYVVEADGGIFGGLHKSTDGGLTFTELDHTGKNYFGYSTTASDDRGQAPRDMDIVVNPADANDVHIAGILSWRSTDGGVNFNITSQWIPGTANALNIGYCHADIDIMEYVDGKLYVGSDGGIFVANNPLVVNSTYYTDLTAGLGIRQFYRIGISQTAQTIVTGGSQDNGSSVMDGSGNWTDWLGADGMEGFVDKNNSNILYGTSQNGTLYKSFNSGISLAAIDVPFGQSGEWVTPFEQDPTTPNVIYAGYDEVYKSTDGGTNWVSISQDFGDDIDELKIAPSNNLVMYASEGTRLFKTTVGGLAGDWTELNGFAGFINSIAIHPSDPNKVAIATTGNQKVYVSTNGGNTWNSYLFDLPNFSARALVWHDNGQDGLYLGMNYGVYYIDNTTGNSWQPFSNNLPNVIISELEINTVTDKIYAGTYGRGLWRSDVYNASLSVDEYELNTITVYPNPATDEINIEWNRPDAVSIRIYDTRGKLLFYSKDRNLSNKVPIDVSTYDSGVYFVKINTFEGEVTKKVIVK